MRFCVLGSGSKGNSTLVMSEEARILIDAGFSCKEMERRLAEIDVDPDALTAIVVSHEHGDHIRGVGVVARKFKVPVYATSATLEAATSQLGRLPRYEEFAAGASFVIGDVKIHPFTVSHDAADPVGFVFENKRARFGYCTDTGIVSRLMSHRLATCRALVFECNHDPELLRDGPYPEALKQRVKSKAGHLANGDALSFLKELAWEGSLSHIVLAHISETNNHPEKIRQAIAVIFDDYGAELPHILLASQDTVGELIEL